MQCYLFNFLPRDNSDVHEVTPSKEMYREVPCIIHFVFLNGNNLNNHDRIPKQGDRVMLFSDDFVPLSLLFWHKKLRQIGSSMWNLIVVYKPYLRASTLMLSFLPPDCILTWPICHGMTWDSARLCRHGGQLALGTSFKSPKIKTLNQFWKFQSSLIVCIKLLLANVPLWFGRIT